MTYLIFQSSPWLLPALILVVLVLAIELPYRLLPKLFSGAKANTDALNVLQAGLLTLSAFVLSLSFSQASARFDSRRALVVTEANAIGTTWLRADQLESTQSDQFRQILVDDAAARIVAYGEPNGSELYQQKIDQSDRDQDELWAIVSAALHAHPLSLGLAQLRQSLNDMIDVASQQRQTLASHVPTAIIALVLVLVTLGAFSLGIRFAVDGSRPLFMSATYVLAYVVVINMMIDYDRPNSGFVTVSLTPLTLQLHSMERALKAPTVPRKP
jgi:hypothetical protein